MKRVIDALRSRPRTDDELKIILNENLGGTEGARRRKRSRYIEDLLFMGIVKRSEGKYQLRLSTEKHTISDDAMVRHSYSLIPALRQIARIVTSRYTPNEGEYISENDMRLRIDCARDHLSSYPDTWELIVDRTTRDEKADRIEEELRLNLMEKLKNDFSDEPIVDPGKPRKHRSFIGSTIPVLIIRHLLYGEPGQIKLEGEEIWFGGSLVAKGTHLLNGVNEFVIRESEDKSNIEAVRSLEKVRNDAISLGPEIEREIRKIILRVESGIPLRGGCAICVATDNPL